MAHMKKLIVALRYFANAPKSSALWTKRVGVLRLTGLVVLAAELRECAPGRTVTTGGRRFPSVPSKARLYSTHYRVYTYIITRTLPIPGFPGGPWTSAKHLANIEVPQSQPTRNSKKYLHYCFHILPLYGRFPLCYN